MARKPILILWAAVTVAALGSCSSNAPEPESAPPIDTATPVGPTVGSTPTAGSPGTPPPNWRNTPECEAFARYKLAELMIGTGTEQQRQVAIEAIAGAYEDVRQALPQYRTELAQQYDALRRSLAGTQTDADRATTRQVLKELDNWYRATCLETGTTTIPGP